MKQNYFALIALLLLIAACAPAPAELTATAEMAEAETQTAAPTKTATYTPAPTATPTNTPTPAPIVLFEDDFSDPNSGWGNWEDATSAIGYAEGEYSILVHEGQAGTTSFLTGSHADVQVQATIRLASGSALSGLACRTNEEESGYAGLVFGSAFGLFLMTDRLEPLAIGSFDPNLAQAGQDIQLTLICAGSDLALFVNGTQVGAARDDSFTQGGVGFIIISQEPETEVLFDDFLLRELPRGYAQFETVYGTGIPIQGANHISEGSDPGEYNNNPPTSGPHYGQQLDAGFYEEADLAEMGAFPHAHAVHNLEHGYVIFWYNCDLLDESDCADMKDQIRAYLDQSPVSKLVAFPWHASDVPLALTSWGFLLELPEFDDSEVDRFIKFNRFLAPEPNAP